MKKLSCSAAYKFLLVFILSFVQVLAFAQDSTSTSTTRTTTTTTTTWYTQPWVWVVGGIVLLIILIALFRGNSSTKDREVTRTTVIKTDKDY